MPSVCGPTNAITVSSEHLRSKSSVDVHSLQQQTFVTDAIGDGPGPVTDFQTFSLVGFTGLQTVQFRSNNISFALDNITVTGSGPAPVPEPAAMVLLGTGLLGIAGTLRKRKTLMK